MRTYSIVRPMNGSSDASGYGPIIRKTSQIRQGGRRIVFIDDGGFNWGPWAIFYDEPTFWDQPPKRHGPGTTVSFADGHSEHWKYSDEETLRLAKMGFWTFRVDWPHSAPGNPDLEAMQKAMWGKLGYTPSP